jgi:hypothetical protein
MAAEGAKAGVERRARARAMYEGRKARRAAEKAVSVAAAASRRLAAAASRAAGEKRKKGGRLGARRHTFKSSRWRGGWNWRGAAAPGAAGGHKKKAKKKKAAPSAEEKAAAAAELAADLDASLEAMSARGLTPPQISLLTGIDPERLYRGHKGAMMRGGARRTPEVLEGGAERAWRLVEAGQARFLRARLRSGRGRDEVGGADLRRLSLEELRALERALRPLAGGPAEVEPKRAGRRRARCGEGAAPTGTVTEG